MRDGVKDCGTDHDLKNEALAILGRGGEKQPQRTRNHKGGENNALDLEAPCEPRGEKDDSELHGAEAHVEEGCVLRSEASEALENERAEDVRGRGTCEARSSAKVPRTSRPSHSPMLTATAMRTNSQVLISRKSSMT